MRGDRLYTGPDQELLCTSCEEIRPVSDFALRYDTKDTRVRSNCRKCLAARQTLKNRENQTDAQVYWWSRQLKKYGLTPITWAEIFNAQGKKCAICRTEDNGKKRFHVDHCHETGKVRGILCTKCNVGIGGLKDDPQVVYEAYLYLSQAVPESDLRDYDFAVSVNPSTNSSQGNTEATDTSGAVETTREALTSSDERNVYALASVR